MVTVSGPAIGDDFFNREKEIKKILKLLEDNNILLIAPRRYGKTSLMREVENRLCKEGYLCIFLDVMYIDRPEEFVIELADAAFNIPEKRKSYLEALKELFTKMSEQITKLIEEVNISIGGSGLKFKFREVLKNEINEDNWTEKGKDVFKAIASIHDKKPIFILIDELSECVNNMIRKNRDARKFLQWFRTVRQTIRDLRFIVGGSVSFDRVVKGIDGLTWINDFQSVLIEGFSKDDVLKFIEKSLVKKGVKYDKKIGEKILECIGEPYIPYFIALFVNMIVQEHEGVLDEKIIDEIYSSKLLGSLGRRYFEYYKDRLRIYYPEKLAKVAEEILRQACLSDEGYPKALAFDIFRKIMGRDDYDKFMDLLSDLENDFYIGFSGDKIWFKSKVLRDWWRIYYGGSFTL